MSLQRFGLDRASRPRLQHRSSRGVPGLVRSQPHGLQRVANCPGRGWQKLGYRLCYWPARQRAAWSRV